MKLLSSNETKIKHCTPYDRSYVDITLDLKIFFLGGLELEYYLIYGWGHRLKETVTQVYYMTKKS